MRKILALDWGEKRIGVAYSDGILATPHSVIYRKSKVKDYSRIAELIDQTGAEKLVIGIPTTFDPENPIGPQAQRVLKHSRALSDILTVPIEMVDETYSSTDARSFLRQAGKRGRISIDAAAAAVILQTYLDQREMEDK